MIYFCFGLKRKGIFCYYIPEYFQQYPIGYWNKYWLKNKSISGCIHSWISFGPIILGPIVGLIFDTAKKFPYGNHKISTRLSLIWPNIFKLLHFGQNTNKFCIFVIKKKIQYKSNISKKVYSSLQIQTCGKTFRPRMAEQLQAWKLRKRYLAVSTSDSVLCQSSLGQSQALFSIQPKNPLMKMIKSPLTQPYLRKKIQKFYFNTNQICKVSI